MQTSGKVSIKLCIIEVGKLFQVIMTLEHSSSELS